MKAMRGVAATEITRSGQKYHWDNMYSADDQVGTRLRKENRGNKDLIFVRRGNYYHVYRLMKSAATEV